MADGLSLQSLSSSYAVVRESFEAFLRQEREEVRSQNGQGTLWQVDTQSQEGTVEL